MKLKYNLQFFAEDEENPEESEETKDSQEIDATAFAELISDKDKKIEELEKDIAELKRSNATLLVKINANASAEAVKKTFEENLLTMVGAKPRKE